MDPLTLLFLLLIIVVVLGGYGYREGWHESTPYATQIFGILVAVIIAVIVLRLFGQVWLGGRAV